MGESGLLFEPPLRDLEEYVHSSLRPLRYLERFKEIAKGESRSVILLPG